MVRTSTAASVSDVRCRGGTIATSPSKPDTTCQRAGMPRSAPVCSTTSRASLRPRRLGVTPRPSTDCTLPDPLPLSVVLADHRAGENSLFVYPWC